MEQGLRQAAFKVVIESGHSNTAFLPGRKNNAILPSAKWPFQRRDCKRLETRRVM
jgi:hypothetical protein